MEYALSIENGPSSIESGTGILLIHPSTVETDRVDTDFLKRDTDHLLVVSTRTTAREVKQKLEYYEVDEAKATILDTLSVERGYTRRKSDRVRYVSSPDDLDGIVDQIELFLEETDGKRRISLDSITEMIYYADEQRARDAVAAILDLLEEHDAVGLFHLANSVHEEPVVAEFRDLFDGIVTLGEDGEISVEL